MRPTAPGYARWQALPSILGARHGPTWLRGGVPTPHGTVHVAWDLRNGSLEVLVPAGTLAERVGIPTLGRGLRRVRVRAMREGHALEDAKEFPRGGDGVTVFLNASYHDAEGDAEGGKVGYAAELRTSCDEHYLYLHQLPTGTTSTSYPAPSC